MYVFGIDVPLVEVIIALGIIAIITLIEIIIILVLINYHLKNSKRLETELAKHIHILRDIHIKKK